MQIKCPKCGYENTLGASIFCRGCGEKIDTSSIQADQLVNDANAGRTKQQAVSIIKTIFTFLIVGLFGWVIWAVFFPAEEAAYEKTEPAAAVTGTLNELLETSENANAKRKKAIQYSFTTEEMTQIFNTRMLSAKEESKDGIKYILFSSDGVSGNKLKLTIKTNMYGATLIFTATGTLKKGDDPANPVSFDVEDILIGRLPAGMLEKNIMYKFSATLCHPDVKKAFSAASEVAFEDGKLTFTFEKRR